MRHVETKEAAKLIRKTLKHRFPGIKFSVRTNSYSMGSHVSIEWTDGPTEGAVDAAVSPFYGTGFDSMTDCTTHHSTLISNEAGEPEEVSFGGSKPNTRRNQSDEAKAQIALELASFASEAAYLVDGTEHDYTVEEILSDVRLPVVYSSPMVTDEPDGYFSVDHTEHEYSSILCRQAFYYRDLMPQKVS
jgi:hypothetical protein